MDEWPAAAVVAVAGGLGGAVLGLAARLGRFCTLAAIEDAMFGRDYRRLCMWGFAMAVAIVGVACLSHFGTVDFSGTLYHRLALNPLAWIIGGLMFGIGMALCGTCGYGTLARVGGGDLRALFVFLILGIAAYMAIAGPTAHLRVIAISPFNIGFDGPSPHTLSELLGTSIMSGTVLAVVVAGALAITTMSNKGFRNSARHVVWSIAVGLAIVVGWWTTGWLGADPFDPQPVASHTYTVPLGQTLIYAMTMSSTALNFGIGTTLGVIAGAFIGSLIKRDFRWEAADDAREMRRHILGAVLMGTGGVYAGGCTIGQGLSAVSVLAISAPIVLLSIWCGVWLGLTYLIEGSFAGALRALSLRQEM